MSRSTLLLASMLLSLGACSSGDGAGPEASTGTVSGVVRDSATSQSIAGATVTVGGSAATTGADGRYAVQGVASGPAVTIQVDATGFQSYSGTIGVQAGPNTRDVSLARQTLYESGVYAMYLTPKVATFRGVLMFMPGSGSDTRLLVRGDPSSPNAPEWPRALALAEKYGLALVGATKLGDEVTPVDVPKYDGMLAKLAEFGERSGHPELATVPLLLQGYSNGGCIVYGFTRLHGDRVLAFVTVKGGLHLPYDAAEALSVPAYAFVGELDEERRILDLTTLFEENRAQGAPWALAIDRGQGHVALRDPDLSLLYKWWDTVIALRMPPNAAPGQKVALRPVDIASGWLGDRSTYEIAQYECYDADPLSASWLPTEDTARNWQRMVSRSSVTKVIPCGS